MPRRERHGLRRMCVVAAACALALGINFGAGAVDLPKATQKAMTDLGIDPALLDGLDAELNVPAAWIEDAKREKDLIVSGTWEPREFREMTAPFRQRYPFINVRYERAGTAGR